MATKFQEECIVFHNMFRARHGAGELQLSEELNKSAQNWAEELLKKDKLENSDVGHHGTVGENISARTNPGRPVDITGKEVTEQWYSDSEKYDYTSSEGQAGNFTQLIWHGSREVGFGKASKDGRCVVVAHYKPPGNVRGCYLNNVSAPLTDKNKAESGAEERWPCTSKTTVITERVTLPSGESYTLHKEVTELKDNDGTIRKQIKEMRIDDSVESATNKYLASYSDCEEGPCSESKEHNCFVKEVIATHNTYRKRHGAKALKRNKELEVMAQKWAEQLTKETALANSNSTYKNERIGENIASRWSNALCDYTGKEVTDHWYSEETKYTYHEEPSNVQGIGNFTQMVWNSSKEIGVGKAKVTDEDGGTRVIVVCHYLPAGNVLNTFKENVSPPK